MKTASKRRVTRKPTRSGSKSHRALSASVIIRKIGTEWATNWNRGDLEKVVALYAPDAVYLPPHHEALRGRDAIRAYLQSPRSHGVSDLAFDVTYIKQSGEVAWDVGTYRMSVPASDSRREDRGKYLTVWKRAGAKWLITADAWSSDLPFGHPMA